MKSDFVGAVCGLLVAGVAAAHAEDIGKGMGTVVELYTSQGCSSCPPADFLLQKLAAQPDVIALALHVDYWDYIGWVDKFASPQYSARQRAYAHAANSNTVYTPQMVVGGVDLVEGNDPEAVVMAIRHNEKTASPVALHLTRQGEQVTIAAEVNRPLESPLQVQLVRYHPLARVNILHGENAGRELDYTNTVTTWTVIGQWDGKGDLHLTAPAKGEDPVVVILQAEGPGPILAAAQVK